MTSRWAVLPAALALVGAQLPTAVSPPAPTAITVAAPVTLTEQIRQLGEGFEGRAGIAVQSVDQGWQAGWRADQLHPQQSVSKLWVAITALDTVDRGKVRLDESVTLTRADLTLFHQPIAAEVIEKGAVVTTLRRLLEDAITKSDNTANDRLMRHVGGAGTVRAMISAKRLGLVRFDQGERLLQSRIAGVQWDSSMSVGRGFYTARDAVPIARRRALFQRYVADPFDGATPQAIVGALTRLKQGKLLSRTSTDVLLHVMANTQTGKNRLRAGLAPGWTLSHKTGTGQELEGVQAGYNDVGILTAPDGRSYAVAVMIGVTGSPVEERMALMQDVVRAIIRAHESPTSH